MMPEHDPTRTDRLALYMRARAAVKAAHDEAVRVVERWNRALAAGRGALWSPTIRCASTIAKAMTLPAEIKKGTTMSFKENDDYAYNSTCRPGSSAASHLRGEDVAFPEAHSVGTSKFDPFRSSIPSPWSPL